MPPPIPAPTSSSNRRFNRRIPGRLLNYSSPLLSNRRILTSIEKGKAACSASRAGGWGHENSLEQQKSLERLESRVAGSIGIGAGWWAGCAIHGDDNAGLHACGATRPWNHARRGRHGFNRLRAEVFARNGSNSRNGPNRKQHPRSNTR